MRGGVWGVRIPEEEELREEMLRTAREAQQAGHSLRRPQRTRTKWPPVLGGPGSAAGRRATLWREKGLHHEGQGAGGEGSLREWHPSAGLFLPPRRVGVLS